MLETKQPIEIKEVTSGGNIFGYGSVFDKLDQGGDIMQKGAFTETLKNGPMPKMLWQHDRTKVIGIWESAKEDDYGLALEGKLLKGLPLADEAKILIEHKAVDGLSIGYRAKRDEVTEDNIRLLHEVELKEVSIVTFPMSVESTITGMKELHSVRDVERILRDAGVPASFAKAVASHGFKAALESVTGDQRDVDPEETIKHLSGLQAALMKLKGTING